MDKVKIDLQVPSSWSCLSIELLRTVAEVTSATLTREEMLLVLLCRFANIKYVAGTRFQTADNVTFTIEPSQLHFFCGKLAYLLDTLPYDIVSPVGVNRHLVETSFGSYFEADALMLKYTYNNDKDSVIGAVRALGVDVAEMDDTETLMMRMWWTGLKRWLKDEYPYVFEGEDNADEGYSPLKARQNILLMLNNDRPHDNKAIEDSLMHDVFSALQHKIETAKEMERMMKK